YGAHFAVDIADGFEQRLLAAFGTAEDVALAHDGHFHLLHRAMSPLSDVALADLSAGRRSSKASMRPRAAFSRDRRLSRSWVTAASCCSSKALVRLISSCRSSRRSTRSASSS